MQPNLIPLPASEDRGNILAKINLRDLYCIMHDGLCIMQNVTLANRNFNATTGSARCFLLRRARVTSAGGCLEDFVR